ncbi:DUF2304 domain-containing protein [Actinomadura parmotrematis]|uniref:DUF2304 domain-containing protein n=1 Tax=Actinomadura parmotrematis TaxID=2864039 RepID=A0ABS7FWI9_9ACTN|nr:DUF2304 domain-containing protein [Actinomadura parmotrematis]MBW8484631.1 DUF2304 domain-containing protein [Actinomadura parmotrematis]
MNVYGLGLLGAGISMLVIFEMLRRRRLREKYAVVWVLVAVAIAVLAIFPDVLTWLADITGVQVPANLLFFGASLVLLTANVQLSSEVSRLEDKVRTLAETIGLERLDRLEHEGRCAALLQRPDAAPAGTAPAASAEPRDERPERR